jgi:hypothetical protein
LAGCQEQDEKQYGKFHVGSVKISRIFETARGNEIINAAIGYNRVCQR